MIYSRIGSSHNQEVGNVSTPRGQSSFRDTLLSRRSIAKRHSAIGIFPFRRRLRIEPLEDRRLLATITVDTLADGIGVPGTSLREAIAAAIANDTINFSATGTINLTNLGHLLVNKSLTISGPGADLLTINAFDPDADAQTMATAAGCFISMRLG